MSSNSKSKTIVLLAIAGIALLATTYWVGFKRGSSSHEHAAETHAKAAEKPKKATKWTCSMHPQIMVNEPGKCPICFMDLIPMEDGDSDPESRILTMSETSKKLAEIQVSPVRRELATRRLRLVGDISYDETRVKTISAWIPGRIQRLYVDYVGMPVKKGDHLALYYSPELLTAQEELIESKKQVDNPPEGQSDFLTRSNVRRLEAVREKLRLYGFEKDQIAAVETSGKAEDHMLVRSPLGGVVVHKNIQEGEYFKTGSKLFRIADLSHLWVQLDAYESDLPWLRYGQEVSIRPDALPGECYKGLISFIDPVLDPTTRTVHVRVTVDNREAKLKPGMYVHGVVESKILEDGSVIGQRLDGKWVCPMHPSVVKDAKGNCDICQMPLIPAAEAGYESISAGGALPLLVPASAVLRTGKRAIVYVELPKAEKPTYEGRVILLGPRAGDSYIVRAGLEEGDRVVTNGNFKIDSALQLKAHPSMMSEGPETDEAEAPHIASGRAAIAALFAPYFEMQKALFKDDVKAALTAAKALGEAVGKVDMKRFGEEHMFWMGIAKKLGDAVAALPKDPDLEAVRKAFLPISSAMIELEKKFGHTGKKLHFLMFCPMANDGDGAHWLQDFEDLRNPYYGSEMLECGETQQRYVGK